MRYTDRQRAYHRQVLREVFVMVLPNAYIQKAPNSKDNEWASKKISALLSNCKA